MEFNSCAALANDDNFKDAENAYNELLANGKDPYQTILDMQNSLQEKLASNYPDRAKKPKDLEKLGDIYAWLRDNKIAFDDEFSELVSALPGMSMPAKARSGIWKKWKANHPELQEKKISELSDADLKELQFEYADGVHFWCNMALALGIDAKSQFIMYYIKNAENFRRYNSGY